MYSCGPLHMDEQRLDDQLEPIYSSPVPIQNVAKGDLSGAMDDRDEMRERVGEICASSTT